MSETKPISDRKRIMNAAGRIAAGYIIGNGASRSELRALIRTVHGALSRIVHMAANPVIEDPAVDPDKSVTPDYLVCLCCGRRFATLRRHVSIAHGLTKDGYRKKWGLDKRYPMTAERYSSRRSRLAKEVGLGTKRKRGPFAAPSSPGLD